MAKRKQEFFERFKINKQVVQAGTLYIMYGVRKNKNRQYIIDRFGILEQIINLSVEKDIFYNEEFDPGSG